MCLLTLSASFKAVACGLLPTFLPQGTVTALKRAAASEDSSTDSGGETFSRIVESWDNTELQSRFDE